MGHITKRPLSEGVRDRRLGLTRQTPRRYAFSMEKLVQEMELARCFLIDAQASLDRLQADPRTDAANRWAAWAFATKASSAVWPECWEWLWELLRWARAYLECSLSGLCKPGRYFKPAAARQPLRIKVNSHSSLDIAGA